MAENQLVFGCGGDEILEIDREDRHRAEGDEVVYGWPSFAMYPIVIQGMGARGVRGSADREFCRTTWMPWLAAVTDQTAAS